MIAGLLICSPGGVCMPTQSRLTLLRPHGLLVHGIFQTRTLGWVAISSSRFPDPGIAPVSLASPTLAEGSLPRALQEAHLLPCTLCFPSVCFLPSSQRGPLEMHVQEFPGGPGVKNPPADAGDMGSVPGLGRFLMLWDD